MPQLCQILETATGSKLHHPLKYQNYPEISSCKKILRQKPYRTYQGNHEGCDLAEQNTKLEFNRVTINLIESGGSLTIVPSLPMVEHTPKQLFLTEVGNISLEYK